MCLGVPGKIVETYEKGGLQMAKVDFGGVQGVHGCGRGGEVVVEQAA